MKKRETDLETEETPEIAGIIRLLREADAGKDLETLWRKCAVSAERVRITTLHSRNFTPPQIAQALRRPHDEQAYSV